MEVNKFRKITKKPILWIAAINVCILIVALIVILNIEIGLKLKITFSSQFVLDLILINSVIGIINFGKTPISLFYETQFDVNSETDQAEGVIYRKSRYCHFLAVPVSIATFFIIVFSTQLANNYAVGEAFRIAWGPALILALINLTILYLNFGLTVYLLNSSEELLKHTLSWRKNFKTEMVKNLEVQSTIEETPIDSVE